MKALVIVLTLICLAHEIAISQTKTVSILTSEKLTHSIGQSLLPITIVVNNTNEKAMNVTFFDIVYLGNTDTSTGRFLIAGKPGLPDIVRRPPVLSKNMEINETTIAQIKSNTGSPDTIILASINCKWLNGILTFKTNHVEVFSKLPNSTFNLSLANNIKANKQLNYSVPTKAIRLKTKPTSISVTIKPYFEENNILFSLTPTNMYKLSQIPKPELVQSDMINHSNCVISIPYTLFNYMIKTYYPTKQTKASAGSLNFILTKFNFSGKQDGLVIKSQIKNIENKVTFNGTLNLSKDAGIQNCSLKPLSNDILSVQLARTAENQINSKYSNKSLFKDKDLSQAVPLKFRGKLYVMYIDVTKLILDQNSAKIYNQIFLENQ